MTAVTPAGSGGSGYHKLTNQDFMKNQGARKYDMCMVFKYKTSKHVKAPDENVEEFSATGRDLKKPTDTQRNQMQAWKQRRESLLKQMKNCGLDLLCFYSRDRDEIFCKIGASSEKLCITAARMKYKLQLKPEYLSAYAEYRQDRKGRGGDPKDRRNYAQMYERHVEADDTPDEGAIFTTRDKINIIHHIIHSKDKDCAGINIGMLKAEAEVQTEDASCRNCYGFFSCPGLFRKKSEAALLQHYFPLHEDKKLYDLSWRNWYQWLWMTNDHTHKVRDYFGDKVAFYYLWMSFYWKWLVVPGTIGAVLQILDVCFHTPDNPTAVPFCIFLAIWTSFLPHFWRRQEAKYAIAWGTFDMVPELEPCRPEHTGVPRINPVTAQVENYYPWQERMVKYVFSFTCILTSGVLLSVGILGLLWCRHNFKDEIPIDVASLSIRIPMSIATWQLWMAIIVELVNVGLTNLARTLTKMENHRTQSEHDTHLLAKVFAFKFVNSYFVLYYIAFVKGYPLADWLFQERMHCIRNDCLLDLQLALAIFMLVRLFVQNMFEFIWPKLKMTLRHLRHDSHNIWHNVWHPSNRLEQADMAPAEVQAKREPYDPFTDFDETLITHGYATLFAASSPWVCTATLIWIVAETILDVRNLTETTQRPLPLKMRTNEPWDTAFDIYGVLAAITNIVMLVFSSKQYFEWTFTEKLMLFIMIFHMIVFAKLLVKWIFPVVPRSVALLNLKQANMVHRCLENIKVEPQQDFSLFRQAGTDNFEIMEQDIFDDEEVEPVLNWKGSYSSMKEHLNKSMDKSLACVLFSAVVLTVAVGGILLLTNVLTHHATANYVR